MLNCNLLVLSSLTASTYNSQPFSSTLDTTLQWRDKLRRANESLSRANLASRSLSSDRALHSRRRCSDNKMGEADELTGCGCIFPLGQALR
ncbi:hypothetical protein SISSUDRAFT_294477 [Sistotremastrum suecicum HHB10207 ss-3]|uniref:Uncharacterized protein n=1 Tax=Sistotremastrum suecicum HHB10207 ss-3 TaxID=1314776 RepID=A0A165ZHS3_9AGAM|nr:hypothetical protein SISSUDRAFT_294477 [Sistotremastrum suecicum HHB10207 ss-3]